MRPWLAAWAGQLHAAFGTLTHNKSTQVLVAHLVGDAHLDGEALADSVAAAGLPAKAAAVGRFETWSAGHPLTGGSAGVSSLPVLQLHCWSLETYVQPQPCFASLSPHTPQLHTTGKVAAMQRASADPGGVRVADTDHLVAAIRYFSIHHYVTVSGNYK